MSLVHRSTVALKKFISSCYCQKGVCLLIVTIIRYRYFSTIGLLLYLFYSLPSDTPSRTRGYQPQESFLFSSKSDTPKLFVRKSAFWHLLSMYCSSISFGFSHDLNQ